MEIIKEIVKWPIIVQGALGSFLFWIFFVISQKLLLFISSKIKEDQKLGSSYGKVGREQFYKKNYDFSNYAFFICIYGSIHYFLKFALSAFIGFVVMDLVPVFGYVGYILALYFIFRALSYVTHFGVFERDDKKKEENIKQPGNK